MTAPRQSNRFNWIDHKNVDGKSIPQISSKSQPFCSNVTNQRELIQFYWFCWQQWFLQCFKIWNKSQLDCHASNSYHLHNDRYNSMASPCKYQAITITSRKYIHIQQQSIQPAKGIGRCRQFYHQRHRKQESARLFYRSNHLQWRDTCGRRVTRRATLSDNLFRNATGWHGWLIG